MEDIPEFFCVCVCVHSENEQPRAATFAEDAFVIIRSIHQRTDPSGAPGSTSAMNDMFVHLSLVYSGEFLREHP